MTDSKKLIDNQELMDYRPRGFVYARPLARQSDPEPSKEGARDAVLRLNEMQEKALQAVQRHPGLTCSEMEAADWVQGRTYGRRLGELAKKGKVLRLPARVCRVTGKKAATWEAL